MNNLDPVLAEAREIVVTVDSVILDAAVNWFNLAQAIISEAVPEAVIVNLGMR